ncbi:hypothetical protein K490DRAFT_49746 [Saccharata proteae CBS 121410]|uniref:Large ribosomal subunit protein mL59 domain-containing protein n=1 Tax=Saccharata proteae CBS 121410 TaxID=1314787 RepID=A0A9P4LWQ7_9PEZI|nr:hypothetical protein K490DRAFT_49746 [Saccharata proteae CBS 121410]
MSDSKHLALAKSLPGMLQRFFTKHPPPTLMPHLYANSASSATAAPTAAPTATKTSGNLPTDTDALAEIDGPVKRRRIYRNPFLPHKNQATGNWQGPAYSLRRQAIIVKLAVKYGVVDLLPWTRKLPSEKEKRRQEQGLRVKGTGVGQKVKGKQWERMLKGKLEARRQAMLKMPDMIQEWKQRGHGRGWKKWPK